MRSQSRRRPYALSFALEWDTREPSICFWFRHRKQAWRALSLSTTSMGGSASPHAVARSRRSDGIEPQGNAAAELVLPHLVQRVEPDRLDVAHAPLKPERAEE